MLGAIHAYLSLQVREQRKRRKIEAAAAAKAAQRAGGGQAGGVAGAMLPGPARGDVLGLMFRQQAAAITQVPWQVVHVAETHVAGKFKVRRLTFFTPLNNNFQWTLLHTYTLSQHVMKTP